MGCWLSGPWSDRTVSGRSLTHLSQRDALQILAAAQHPITMQIKSQRRGQKTDHASTWEPLPLGLQHLNLPRSFYSQLPVPQDCGPRFGFMSSSPRDTLELGLQDPELIHAHKELSHAHKELSHAHKEPSCLSCCRSNGEEPLGFNQPDEDDFLLEKPLGFLPLHHELDSGLGWTDGSVHQGELSGLETEEGVDECLPRGGLAAGGCAGLGGSPSSESFISSELSDSGFYSVSTVEFRHFQRLLEKRMRVYNARLQSEAFDRSERRDSCPKSHPLEAIPESLPVHRAPDHRAPEPPPCPQHGPEAELQRGLFRVSSVQFHKSDRPSLNRHSSSSSALFNPAHSVMSRLNAPILSTCSTPSSHRRGLLSHGPQQQHNGDSLQPLRRSRTLHYRPPQAEYRRRASHPASPSYYTLHQCPAPPAAAMLELPHVHGERGNVAHRCDANTNYEQYWRERSEQSHSIPDNQQWAGHLDHQRVGHLDHQRLNHRELEQKLEQEQRRMKQVEAERRMREEHKEHEEREERKAREAKVCQSLEFNRLRFRENNSSFSQSGEANDTWPKPNTRNLQHSGGARGMYSTLDGPAGSASGGRNMCGGLEAPAGSASGGRNMCGGLEVPAGSASGGRNMCGGLEVPAGSASGGRNMYGALEAPARSASGGRSMCGAMEAPAGSASGGRNMCGGMEVPAGSASGGRNMCGGMEVPAGSASGGRNMYGALEVPAGSTSGGKNMYGALEAPAGSASGGRNMCGGMEAPAGSASGGRSMCGAMEAPAGSASGGRSMCGAMEAPAGCTSEGRSMCGALEAPAGSASWDIHKAQSNSKLAQRAVAVSRVSRSQLLRHRASQLNDERSGMSTDEETGDMLLGRYWSRTERKEHFLLARELRQARGDRSSSRERERSSAAPEDPRASTVLELSHRKLSRLRNRKLLDDWTTVEELLTHGNRLDHADDALTCPSSLLTVTTV